MEEKYYIINNKHQYYVIIKCKEQTLLDESVTAHS